jgi:PAS domain S-box-containing protein
MKDLKSFAGYLIESQLSNFSKDTVAGMKGTDIPVLELLPSVSEEEMHEKTRAVQEKFLKSLQDGSALQKAQESIRLWQEDKIPGLSKHDIKPSDLVLLYAVQKKVMWSYLKKYTQEPDEIIAIMNELEDYYTQVQDSGIKMLFDIHGETETQLRQSEERYRDLFENTNDLIFIINLQGKVDFANKAWMEAMGYTSGEIMDVSLQNVVPVDGRTRYLEEIEKAQKQAPAENFELTLVSKRGNQLNLEGHFSCKLHDGKPDYMRGIFRNITIRKKIEKELQERTKELERSNQELEQFAYVASHDLQEPLRMVNSYVQLLASRYKDKLDKDANEFIHFAVDGSNRMRSLISSLLAYSRVNRVKAFDWMDLNKVLDDVLFDLAGAIAENHAQITREELPTIYGDAVLIGQLFQNLIANAIKFKGIKSPEIGIRVLRNKGEDLFEVRDNGIGIKEEYAEKIFTIFQRLHGNDKYPGTGIGLAICKKIVERHGGQIWLKSQIGEGASFYFTLRQ